MRTSLLAFSLLAACSPSRGGDALTHDSGTGDGGGDAGSADLGPDAITLDLGHSDLGADAATHDASTDMPTTDASTDPITAVCRIRVDGAAGCSAACSSAGTMASMGPCAAQFSALASDPELTAFGTCSSACPTARTCGTEMLTDCDCGTACVRAQSAHFQMLFEAAGACIAPYVTGPCS